MNKYLSTQIIEYKKTMNYDDGNSAAFGGNFVLLYNIRNHCQLLVGFSSESFKWIVI